ncbi:MAG TPA: hypothetical protein VFC82_09060 [Actinomycetaceae bacterium]|nr:hypothetical protein [Actinomycetaceae bacterium]
MSEPTQESRGRSVLTVIIMIILGLFALGIAWRVLRGLLWLLAIGLLFLLLWVAWREYQHSRSWSEAFSASLRVLGNLGRGAGRMFRGEDRDQDE